MRAAAYYLFIGFLLLGGIVTPGAVSAEPSQSLTSPESNQPKSPPIQVTGELSPQLKDALALVEAGQYDQAITAAEDAMTGAGAGKRAAPAYEIVGIAQYLKGDTDAAIASLKHAIELDPAQSSAFTRLGSIALAGNRPAEAKTYFQTALRTNPGDVIARRRLAIILQGEGDIDGAIREYRRLLAPMETASIADKATLAALYNRRGRYGDTIALLAPVVDAQSRNPLALLALGGAYLGAGDGNRALPLLKSAQKLDPNNAQITLVVGAAQRAAGQIDASVATLKQAVKANPRSVSAYYQLALTYLAKSKFQDAQDALAQAQRLDPESKELQESSAETLLVGGKTDQAVAAFKALTQRDNAKLTDFAALATAYQTANRPGDAEQTYRDAVARFPTDPAAYWRLGAMLALHGKYQAALETFATGEKLAPDDPRLLRDVALASARLKKYPAALASAEHLLALNPKNPEAQFLVAGLYQDSGNRDRAIELYRAIVAEHPDYPWALNNLASMLTDNGDAGSAIPLAERAAKLLPDNAMVADTLGWALLKGGRAPEAVNALERARTLAPSNPETLYRLAAAQKAAGDSKAARQSAQQALTISADFKDAAGARALVAE